MRSSYPGPAGSPPVIIMDVNTRKVTHELPNKEYLAMTTALGTCETRTTMPAELAHAFAALLAQAPVADLRKYPKLPESHEEAAFTVVSPRGLNRSTSEPVARDNPPGAHRLQAARGQGRPCSRGTHAAVPAA